jgi:hypothetical protein
MGAYEWKDFSCWVHLMSKWASFFPGCLSIVWSSKGPVSSSLHLLSCFCVHMILSLHPTPCSIYLQSVELKLPLWKLFPLPFVFCLVTDPVAVLQQNVKIYLLVFSILACAHQMQKKVLWLIICWLSGNIRPITNYLKNSQLINVYQLIGESLLQISCVMSQAIYISAITTMPVHKSAPCEPMGHFPLCRSFVLCNTCEHHLVITFAYIYPYSCIKNTASSVIFN